jgi:hypothetical protein
VARVWQVGEYSAVVEPSYPYGIGGLRQLPDLGSMTNAALSDLLRDLLAKAEVSPEDRLLEGAVDVVRAEIAARGGYPFARPS